MCKLGLVFLISLLTGNNYAQSYFVLLQSDNRQPFYVRLGGQRYTSSSEGHLILGQLNDSTYTIAIGFPSKPGAEQTYSIGTAQKDQEFLIKDRGDAGWGLFDPLGKDWLTVIARSGGREEVRAIGVRRDDAFSRLMAGVVQDTAVLYNDYAAAELATSGAANSTAPPPNANTSAASSSASPSKPDSSVISVTTTSAARPDSPAVTGAVDSVTHAATVQPGSSTSAGTEVQLTATSQPNGSQANVSQANVSQANGSQANGSHSDTVTMNPTPLNRPKYGKAQHKSAPVVDSTLAGPLHQAAAGVIKKVSEKRLTRNMRLVYADNGSGGKADTVVVMIPLDTAQAVTAKPRAASPNSARTAKPRPTRLDSAHIAKSHEATLDSSRAVKSRPIPDSGKSSAGGNRGPNPDSPSQGSSVRAIIPTPVNLPADKTRANDSAKKPVTKAALPYLNSDCHNFATDYDIDKLRVKMLEAAKDEDRVTAALKVFKTKCFFTRQIRALSEVFTTDAGKFHFFETAYPFAADEHFHELSTQLADPVYLNKFKTLTGSH